MRTAIGIDIGGTHVRAARVSADGKVLGHRSIATQRDVAALLGDLDSLVGGLRELGTIGIGIGIPGRVDGSSGRILSGGYVDLTGHDLNAHFERAQGLRAVCDNDANMALLAEARLGAAKGQKHVVMLTIGTGIGGAILADGQLFHGGGTAGQLGHITVSAEGAPCNCGRRGCLETESSGTALQRHMKHFGVGADQRADSILASDSPACRNVVQAWAEPLRAGLDSLAAAFSPMVIVLGGGLGGAACQALQRVPAGSPWFTYDVVEATLGDDAGVIGAGLAALERLA